MKVVQLSTCELQGGAARAAQRLHRGLLNAGVDSSMLVRYKQSEDSTVRVCPPTPRSWHPGKLIQQYNVRRLYRRRDAVRARSCEWFSLHRSELSNAAGEAVGSADVANLHWIAEYVDTVETLPRLAATMPIVWTVHDMNPFTGGCHYDGGCQRFNRGCGFCPQLVSGRAHDLSQQVWQRKRAAYLQIPRERLHLVAPSGWMEQQLRRSALLGRFGVTTIPNGLDMERFSPVDQAAARRALQLPTKGQIVLFVAHSMTVQRKGWQHLLASLAELSKGQDRWLVSVGGHDGELPEQLQHMQHIALGSISDERKLAMAYSAADLFVIPSEQDNLPNTVMEALACGTPVVGFAAGGIPDMVIPGETGELAPMGDAAALAAAIERTLSSPRRLAEMRRAARERAVRCYSLQAQVKAYIALYRQLLADHPAAEAA